MPKTMNRRQILAAVRATGRKCAWSRLEYALQAGHIEEPPRNASGDRVYSERHLTALINYIDAKTAKKAAKCS